MNGELGERSEDKSRAYTHFGNTEISVSSPKVWTSTELLALCGRQKTRSKLGRQYKHREPYQVYTCKLPKDMIAWLKANDGASLIRRFVHVLMSENKNSVIPKLVYSPSASSLSSPSSPKDRKIVFMRLGKR